MDDMGGTCGLFSIWMEREINMDFGVGANPHLLSPDNSPYTLATLKMVPVRVPPPLKAKAF